MPMPTPKPSLSPATRDGCSQGHGNLLCFSPQCTRECVCGVVAKWGFRSLVIRPCVVRVLCAASWKLFFRHVKSHTESLVVVLFGTSHNQRNNKKSYSSSNGPQEAAELENRALFLNRP